MNQRETILHRARKMASHMPGGNEEHEQYAQTIIAEAGGFDGHIDIMLADGKTVRKIDKVVERMWVCWNRAGKQVDNG